MVFPVPSESRHVKYAIIPSHSHMAVGNHTWRVTKVINSVQSILVYN